MRDRKVARFGSLDSSMPTGAVFSPDGRWVAYSTRASGRRNAVYVQPFPPTEAKYQVSRDADDGHHPVWSANGTELFFVPGPGEFSVVNVRTQPTFTFGEGIPVPRLFNINAPQVQRTFDIDRDGKRFLGLVDSAQSAQAGATAPQIQVVLNWFEDLKARLPVRYVTVYRRGSRGFTPERHLATLKSDLLPKLRVALQKLFA